MHTSWRIFHDLYRTWQFGQSVHIRKKDFICLPISFWIAVQCNRNPNSSVSAIWFVDISGSWCANKPVDVSWMQVSQLLWTLAVNGRTPRGRSLRQQDIARKWLLLPSGIPATPMLVLKVQIGSLKEMIPTSVKQSDSSRDSDPVLHIHSWTIHKHFCPCV